MRRLMREMAFRLARRDLALFLYEHEADLLEIFRGEMQRLDDELPEERLFIDIKMVPMGEMLMKAVLRTLYHFLLNEDRYGGTAEVAPDEEPQ